MTNQAHTPTPANLSGILKAIRPEPNCSYVEWKAYSQEARKLESAAMAYAKENGLCLDCAKYGHEAKAMKGSSLCSECDLDAYTQGIEDDAMAALAEDY